MADEKILLDFDPNDFIIRISPFLDEQGKWTGELLVGNTTTDENYLDDDDYLNLMRLVHMVLASVPAMEENEMIREVLYKYAESVQKEEQEKIPKVTSKQGSNVIELNFK